MRSFFLLIFLFPVYAYSQLPGHDYLEYNRKITEISVLIFEGDEETALQRFDSLYETYGYVFGAHVYMGLQLAAKKGDEEKGFKYLGRAIQTGVKKALIQSDSIICGLKQQNPGRWEAVFNQYETYRENYLARINTTYKHLMDSIYADDQDLTQKLNNSILMRPYYWLLWKKKNKEHVQSVRSLMDEYGYPGEKIMGISSLDFIDTITPIKNRYGTNCFISFHKTLFILVHYYSDRREDMNAFFLTQVKNGNMTAYEYAVVNDFMAAHGKRKYDSLYYNVWQDAPAEQYEQVNRNRSGIGLCDLSVQKRYRDFWKNIRAQRLEYKTIFLPALL